MIHLRSFLESFDWWNLSPVLPDDKAFEPRSKAYVYARTQSTHVLYFFAKSVDTGEITDLQPDQVLKATWYNPRSGEKLASVQVSAGKDGRLALPEKPDSDDWVLMISE